MQLIDYTTLDDIRAVLGISEEEVSNADLSLESFAISLELKLSDISESLASAYSAVKAIPEASMTAKQLRFYKTVRLYAAYAVAENLLTSLPNFGFKVVTDGKAKTERFDHWEDVKSGILATLNSLKIKVRIALAAIDGTYVAPETVAGVFIVGVATSTNPVTGV